MEVRRLTPSDIPAALELSSDAGWNQTQADWRMLLGMEPEGCLRDRARRENYCYCDSDFLWRGSGLDRHGFDASAVSASRLRQSSTEGNPAIGGSPADCHREAGCYRKRTAHLCGSWVHGRAARGTLAGEGSVSWTGAARRRRAGSRADRVAGPRCLWRRSRCFASSSLREGRADSHGDEYLFHRSGRLAHYLGPCIAGSGAGARAGITRLLNSRGDKAYFWDLLPSNQGAVSLATELGFTRVRRLVSMRWGKPLPGKDGLILRLQDSNWDSPIRDIQSEEELDDLLSEPSQADVEAVRRLDGDLLILGAAGKWGRPWRGVRGKRWSPEAATA